MEIKTQDLLALLQRPFQSQVPAALIKLKNAVASNQPSPAGA